MSDDRYSDLRDTQIEQQNALIAELRAELERHDGDYMQGWYEGVRVTGESHQASLLRAFKRAEDAEAEVDRLQDVIAELQDLLADQDTETVVVQWTPKKQPVVAVDTGPKYPGDSQTPKGETRMEPSEHE